MQHLAHALVQVVVVLDLLEPVAARPAGLLQQLGAGQRVLARVGRGDPSRRTSQGSVSPWMSSVPRGDENATSSSTSRCRASSGIAKAAASVTTPRMPAQPTTAV